MSIFQVDKFFDLTYVKTAFFSHDCYNQIKIAIINLIISLVEAVLDAKSSYSFLGKVNRSH